MKGLWALDLDPLGLETYAPSSSLLSRSSVSSTDRCRPGSANALPLMAGLGLATLVLGGTAAASPDVTDLAPVYRGDLEVSYEGALGQDRLIEDGEVVGNRSTGEHLLHYRLTASLLTGVGLVLEIPHWAAQDITFADGHSMEFDPLDDDGTMSGTAALGQNPTVQGGGLGGTWVGIRGAPFHEEAFSKRTDRFSWLIEGGFRFKDKSNFYTVDDTGKRGAGPGAPGWRLITAFSTTHNRTSPYMQYTLVRSSRINAVTTDASGSASAVGLEIRPSSILQIDTGAEVMLSEYGEDGGRVTLDLSSRFVYDSWQDIPSGLYLPSILDASRGSIVTQDETLTLQGGIGLNWRMVEYAQLNLQGGAGVSTPHQLEHLYGVGTGLGAWHWYVGSSIRFRARDPLFQDIF